MKTKVILDDEKLNNQDGLSSRSNPPIPKHIITANLTNVSELTSSPNLPSKLSSDLNTPKGAYFELTSDYFQMIQNNDQVKDKYKVRIDKGKKFQNNLKGALKGSTLKSEALYIFGVTVLGKDIWEYKK